jgi:hypothetical protein
VILPPPSVILATMAANTGLLWSDFVQTIVKGALSGYVIGCGAAILVAIAVDRSPFLTEGLLPVGNFVAALPIVGVAPIMVTWFGFGWESKAAVVSAMVFFPVLINAVAGLKAADRMQADLMQTWSAGYWQTLLYLRLPAAMPHLQRAQDFDDAGADRGHRRRILRLSHPRHGLPHLDRGRIACPADGLGADCRGRLGGDGIFRARDADRTARHVLAPVAAGGAVTMTTRRYWTMKKLLAGTVLAALTASGAWAQDSVRMQLKWVTQAQFAGYYVAEAKGFYDEENLDVTILPGGPDIAPEQVIAGGGADVITTWMPAALAARERGVPLVNIAQPFKNQGLSFVCRKDMGVETVEDFPGKTLGVWFFGNEYPFYAWMASLGLATDGSEGGVRC